MKRSIIERLFWNPNYFTIAIRKKKDEKDSLFNNRYFYSELELKSIDNYWKADPILVQSDEKTYLFYEACHNGKGTIEVVEISDEKGVSSPTTVLEKKYHLSYPFVFSDNSKWYMIPESSEVDRVDLYIATEFPYKWEKVCTLLDEHAVDTTIKKVKDRYLMVTFIPIAGSEEVMLKAYWLKLIDTNNISLDEIKVDDFEPLKVRGAGGFLEKNGKLFRPAQINGINSYGEGIAIKEIEVNEKEYKEKNIFDIYPENIKVNNYRYDGLHTYTETERYEAIDIRCSFFDLLKPIKKIIAILKR
ncbi:MAG: hypothetical protein K6G88_11400 [Lachnospiraceae bacterium]|nr:hypothetical protein [Lachnospiraceae bacterium]